MKLHLSALFLLVTISISAQTHLDMLWQEGSVLVKGEEQKGAIRLAGGLKSPWLNNAKVFFISEENYVPGQRVKRKHVEEYKPEDLDGYSTFSLDYNRERVEMDYITKEIMVAGMLKKKKKKVFLRIHEQGAINIYSYTPKPAKDISVSAQQENNEAALRQSTFYLGKGEEELIASGECVLVDYLEDCPTVVEKIKSQAYGFKPKAKRKKRKGFTRLLEKSAGDNALENKIYVAIEEYNDCVDK